jgi:hypothetical protein
MLIVLIASVFLGACTNEEVTKVNKTEEKNIEENKVEKVKNKENDLVILVDKEKFETEITETGIKISVEENKDKQLPEASLELQLHPNKRVEEIKTEKLKEYSEYILKEETSLGNTSLSGKKDVPYIPRIQIDIKEKGNGVLVVIEKTHLEVSEEQIYNLKGMKKTIKLED